MGFDRSFIVNGLNDRRGVNLDVNAYRLSSIPPKN